MKKLIIILFIFLTSFSIALASQECGRFTESKNIPCRIISSYNATDCYVTGTVLNETSSISLQNLSWENYTRNCFAWFNITIAGTYTYNGIESGIITVRSSDDMVGIGVILFLILLNAALFIVPFIVKFTDDEVTNLICKRSVLLVGLAVLAFVTTIIITLADKQGLGITQDLFVFQWIFLNAIYVGMILLFFSFFVSVPKLWAAKKKKERMGEE